jgi:hypothetical protein
MPAFVKILCGIYVTNVFLVNEPLFLKRLNVAEKDLLLAVTCFSEKTSVVLYNIF